MTRPSSAGSLALSLLAPQIVLGAILATGLDSRLPYIAQVLTLLHVVSAIASVLAFAVWSMRHGRGRTLRAKETENAQYVPKLTARILAAVAAAAACVTGFVVLWFGEGTRAGDLHAMIGVGAAVPLACHLVLDGRGRTRKLAWLYFVVAPLAIPSVRAAVRPSAPPPKEVAFSRTLNDPDTYESAEWCGSCHIETAKEWSHSTHARALAMPSVRHQFEREMRQGKKTRVDADVTNFETDDGQHCVQCHSPLTFYGDIPKPVLEDTERETQGINCAFCHTTRGSGPNGLLISAPGSVHRYLGQGSKRLLPRMVADLLIRWRPEAHRRDYHVPYLEQSAMCGACHIESFETWKESSYAGHSKGVAKLIDAPDAVTCQDCHMAHEPKAERVQEAGPLVPWGEVRPQRRHHGFIGGNARAAVFFGDQEALLVDRKLRKGMLSMKVISSERKDGYVLVRVSIRNEKVGHLYPSGEGGDARNQWLQIETLDSAGHQLAVSEVPDIRNPDFLQAARYGVGIPLIHQSRREGQAAEQDTRIPPKEERTFELALPDRAEITRVRAGIRSTFDPGLVASAEATFDIASK